MGHFAFYQPTATTEDHGYGYGCHGWRHTEREPLVASAREPQMVWLRALFVLVAQMI